jgi:hypothetical protein
MKIRLISFLIAAALLAGAADDERAADRAAIRAHIDRIFQAFIHKDERRTARHARRKLARVSHKDPPR